MTLYLRVLRKSVIKFNLVSNETCAVYSHNEASSEKMHFFTAVSGTVSLAKPSALDLRARSKNATTPDYVA